MSDDRPIERGREPGNWELMRGIERLERRFDDAAKGFVSVVVHNLLVERVKEIEGDLDDVRKDAADAVEKAKADAAAQITTVTAELNSAKKQRAQTWTSIGLLAATVLISSFWDIFSKGLGIP